MTQPRRQAADVLADLVTWLRQQDPHEQGAWALLPPGPAPALTLPQGPPAGPPAPASSAASASTTPATAAAEAFARECARFVQEALAAIERNRRADLVLALGEPPAGSALGPEERAAALQDLCAQVLPCTACGLHAGRNSVVFGAGSPQARLVFVGEAPGQEEDRQGLPFVGRSGQLLTKILAAIAFAREDVFICNILKCRPPENRDPLPAEVAACEPHLQRQLQILQPRLICCLGRIAAQTLLKTDAPLTRLRRAVHFYRGIPVLVTFHPAYLLRNPASKREAWDDVRRLRALYDALGAAPGAPA